MTLLGACEAARKRIFWPTPRLKEGTLKALVPDQKKSELLRPWYSMAKLMQCSHRFSTNWCQHPLQSSSSSASMQRFHGSFLWLDSYLPSFFCIRFFVLENFDRRMSAHFCFSSSSAAGAHFFFWLTAQLQATFLFVPRHLNECRNHLPSGYREWVKIPLLLLVGSAHRFLKRKKDKRIVGLFWPDWLCQRQLALVCSSAGHLAWTLDNVSLTTP